MARKHLCSKSQYTKMVFWHFLPTIPVAGRNSFGWCATPLWMMTGTFPSVSCWYLCLLKWTVESLWMAYMVSMGLSLSLAKESQHQINCKGTTYWKATGRKKRTETQAIGTRMLRWDVYQDSLSLAHITTGRSKGEWKKQKLGEKDICLFSFHYFAFSKHHQVFK